VDPIYSDFVHGKLYYRRKFGDNRRAPMIRAISASEKPLKETTVLDATGGLGKDAFIMAALGCKVTVVEQNPIIWALLQNGYQRGKEDPETAEILSRMSVVRGDSRQYLRWTIA
jgi:16S rRNA (guanine1516-N2)-methyltransferase